MTERPAFSHPRDDGEGKAVCRRTWPLNLKFLASGSRRPYPHSSTLYVKMEEGEGRGPISGLGKEGGGQAELAEPERPEDCRETPGWGGEEAAAESGHSSHEVGSRGLYTLSLSPAPGSAGRGPLVRRCDPSSSSPRCVSRALRHSEVGAGPAPSLGAHRIPALALAERARVLCSHFSEQDPLILLSRMCFSLKR